jgi:PA14 domain
VRWIACGLALLAVCAAVAQQSEPPVKFGVTIVIPSGLKGQIYKIKKDSDRLPNFKKMKPIGTVYTSSLNVPARDFREGFPGVTKRNEWFAIDYTGRFWIEKPGRYRFVLMSDDGSKLYIDDDLVVDNDGIHAPAERSGRAELTRGVHRIRVSYFQGPRFHVSLVLRVACPGEEYRVFSTDGFKPPADFESW